jgi:broad specificity phosphatase PhoE
VLDDAMLIVVRHGRTEANASGRLLGRLDPPLDDLGQRQADAVADLLHADGVNRVVSSPLLRARSTAAAIADRASVDVEIDANWIEVDYGVLDGIPLADVPAATWAQWRSDPDFAPEGGESLATVAARVATACDQLVEQAADANIVVVSHVSPVKAAVCWALGVGSEVAWRTFVAPGSVTRINRGPAGPVLASFNERPPVDRPD